MLTAKEAEQFANLAYECTHDGFTKAQIANAENGLSKVGLRNMVENLMFGLSKEELEQVVEMVWATWGRMDYKRWKKGNRTFYQKES